MDKKNLKLWFCTCIICTQLVHTDLSPSFKINPAYCTVYTISTQTYTQYYKTHEKYQITPTSLIFPSMSSFLYASQHIKRAIFVLLINARTILRLLESSAYCTPNLKGTFTVQPNPRNA